MAWPGLEILDSKKAHEMEPNLSDEGGNYLLPDRRHCMSVWQNIAFAENA